MSLATEADVVVVGAGPAGLLTALGLARAGARVTVLEAENAIVRSPRAMVYHWSVLDGLEALGLLDDAMARGFTKAEYEYRTLGAREQVHWTMDLLADQTPYPFNLHLGQHELAALALQRLLQLPGTAVHWASRVTSLRQDATGVDVGLQDADATFRARWCVGADGARSTVRRLLGLPFEGFTWPDRFVATNLRFDFAAAGFSRSTQVADPDHGAIVSQIDLSGLWRWTYAEASDLDDASVASRMAGRLAALVGAPVALDVDRFQPYRMHQRSAPTFRRGRVLLIGDAAHATNPTGGFGLTSALFSSYALVPELLAVLAGASTDRLDAWASDRRTRFVELASPQASELKRKLYSERDPARREADLADMRRAVTNPALLRERLTFTARLRSDLGGAGA